MSVLDKMKDFVIDPDTEGYEEEFEEEEEVESRGFFGSKPSTPAPKAETVVLFEPVQFDEAQDVANKLKQRKAALVNLHKLNEDKARRVIDFLAGVIYAIEGEVNTIDQRIYLFTPKNIGVTGTIEVSNNEE